MENKNSNLMQYESCIMNADVKIISLEEKLFTYNGFSNPALLRKNVRKHHAEAILSIDKDYTNHHTLTRQSFILFSQDFIDECSIQNEILIHPSLLIYDENNNILNYKDVTDDILKEIEVYSKIQCRSVHLFINMLGVNESKINEPETTTENIPTCTIRNHFSKVDIVEFTHLCHHAGLIEFNESEFNVVVNKIAGFFGIDEIVNARIQRYQLTDRISSYMLLDKLNEAAKNLEDF
jgi:hypothetical protein